MTLSDRIAMVTGAAGGIGRATVERLAKEGARVVATDLAFAAARGRSRKLDVTSRKDVQRVVSAVIEEFGTIDILVNNAGTVTLAPLIDLTDTDWNAVFDVNARGTFLCTQEVVRHMIARGKGGRIINISSIAACVGFTYQSHYCAAKAAVIGFTRALAAELGPYGITVNAIGPGAVDTEMLEKALMESSRLAGVGRDQFAKTVVSSIPLGRLQRPEDIAHAVAFLASPRADNITGETINVDGGIVRN